ncbi:Ubiquitin domain-containing protein DSK2 [Choanephora cucurbitarum]|uniref:Ubiquitin domain-containing protein DSK2 n=1 Tax=Choanephora cucurbitarum TaxID=101091 RepID=A0A1C7N9V0_9FUNG|nr:Ubiquitin domain-containing protein DSK2 [Choanephora cucurbitarum]
MSSINVNIKSSSDKKFIITIETEKTVLDLKTAIAEQTEVPADRQRLIYSGRVLKDHDTLADCKIADGNTVHMVKGSQPATTTTTTPNTNTTPSTTPSTAPNTPANPFAGLAGMPADSQSNPFNMFGAGFGAGALGNSFGAMDPNMTNQMLQNPMFAQYMSSVLQNPAILDNIIQTNPQLASMGPEIRNMMQSPEFRQMLSNPDMIRQMASMASLMQNNGLGTTSEPANPFASLGNAPAIDPQLQQRMAALFGGGGGASPTDSRPPEERFQVQLQQLNEMGFWDAAKNIRALTATGGNVNAAIEMLFSDNI